LKLPDEEIRRLKRENEELKEEKEILKKPWPSSPKPKVKYQFIESHRSEFAVKKMCRVLGVSRSGYYKWAKHIDSDRQKSNEHLLVRIRDAYVGVGYIRQPRVTAELKSKGLHAERIELPS